jgi:hypothetical protein
MFQALELDLASAGSALTRGYSFIPGDIFGDMDIKNSDLRLYG